VTRQLAAIEQARATGVEVLVEPMTERLADPGFTPRATFHTRRADPLIWAGCLEAGQAVAGWLKAVVATQTEATIVTTPHFYVWDEHSAQLNLDLAAETAELAGCRCQGNLAGEARSSCKPRSSCRFGDAVCRHRDHFNGSSALASRRQQRWIHKGPFGSRHHRRLQRRRHIGKPRSTGTNWVKLRLHSDR